MSGQVRNSDDNYRVVVSGDSRTAVFCGGIDID